ncbi:hypothetical protein A1O1_05322 [Capronia coronata CBS 617.96]|uniref:Uncharacterized protein n=1 Tax=Capronia coronata CBS 617.96 TaxID=1182541 RepID=W9Y6E5_9EURO|nr:uncharacterized protein A1O1_05322 [Capronia coronata CBS 617.96]EXJ88392.1 hypothetical protein A1O1_05322 [Capronia coronata CBS 617.96]
MDTTLDSKLIGKMIHTDYNTDHCNERHEDGSGRPQSASISNPPNRDVQHTTLDSKLIGRMIHADCNTHHCNGKHEDDSERPQPTSISNPLNGEVPAPEYLHCGFWPRPLTNADVDEESHEPRGLHDHHYIGTGRSRPVVLTWSKGPEWSTKANPQGNGPADDDDEPETIQKGGDHHSVVTDQFSKAVDTWRMKLHGSDSGEEKNDEKGMWSNVKKSPLRQSIPQANVNSRVQARKPYSVLRLFARRSANDRNTGSIDGTVETRQSVFDQEIAAECRARSEIMEYVDNLVNRGDFDDAYACIWPLEEYRRNGWAEEMIFAFPNECLEFVDMVHARQKTS